MLKATMVNVEECDIISLECFNLDWIFISGATGHFSQGSALGKNQKSDVTTPWYLEMKSLFLICIFSSNWTKSG